MHKKHEPPGKVSPKHCAIYRLTEGINSGGVDELFENGETFYLNAKAAGVDITFRKGIGMVHCYPLLAPMFKEATLAMDEIADFIQSLLSNISSG